MRDYRGPFKGGGVYLSGREFARLNGPIVYAWMRQDTFMYIGMSKRGIMRLILPHHVVKDVDRDKDWFFFWPCESVEAAERLERRLIRRMRPDLNKLWNPDNPEWANGFVRRAKKVPPGRARVPHFRSSYWRSPKA